MAGSAAAGRPASLLSPRCAIRTPALEFVMASVRTHFCVTRAYAVCVRYYHTLSWSLVGAVSCRYHTLIAMVMSHENRCPDLVLQSAALSRGTVGRPTFLVRVLSFDKPPHHRGPRLVYVVPGATV